MPTDDQRAFWSAIRANPYDDAPRLVYADWLQENGDEARAEFIRVQCALSKLPYDRRKNRKQRKALEARERELLGEHGERWTGDLYRALADNASYGSWRVWSSHLDFCRGFLRSLYLSFPAALRLIGSGLELEPIHYLEISHGRHAGNPPHEAVVAVASWEGGGGVSTFSLAGASDKDVRAFLAGGRLTNLFRLDFWHGWVGNEAVIELARSPLVAPVRSMCLSANRIGDAGATALAESPHLSAQCLLNLYSNPAVGGEARRRLRERFGEKLQMESGER